MMKKWLSLVLVLTLCCTSLLGDVSLAFASELEEDSGLEHVESIGDENEIEGDVSAEPVESVEVQEDFELPADGDFGLFAATGDEPATVDAPADEKTRYARLNADSEVSDNGAVICTLAKDDIVYMTGEAADGSVPVAFNVNCELVRGRVAEAACAAIMRSELDALMEGQTDAGAIAYEDDIDILLPQTHASFPEAANSGEQTDAGQQPETGSESGETAETDSGLETNGGEAEGAQGDDDGAVTDDTMNDSASQPEGEQNAEGQAGEADEQENDGQTGEADEQTEGGQTSSITEQNTDGPQEEAGEPDGRGTTTEGESENTDGNAVETIAVVPGESDGEGDNPTNPSGVGEGDNPTVPSGVGEGDNPTDPSGVGEGDDPTDPSGVGEGDDPTDPSGVGEGDNPTDPSSVGEGDNPTDPDHQDGVDAVPHIDVEVNAYGLGVGDVVEIAAHALDEAGEAVDGVQLAWSTSDEAVATVSETGTVTAVAPGMADIAISAEGFEPATVSIVVERVTLDEDQIVLMVGDARRLSAVVEGGSGSAVIYDTSDAQVAAVDAEGNVTAMGKGAAVITARTENGQQAACEVVVNGVPTAVAFGLNENSVSVGVNATGTITGRLVDSDGAEAEGRLVGIEVAQDGDYIEYSTEGNVLSYTAKAFGTATVTYTFEYESLQSGTLQVSDSCKINVVGAPKALRVNRTSITIGKGENYRGIMPTLVPQDGQPDAVGGLRWLTANKKIATVNAAGVIKGVKVGKTKITVAAANNARAKAVITVNVKKAPSKITVSPKTMNLSEGYTGRIAAKPNSGAGCMTYTYESSNEAVVTVDASGLVTAVGKGTTTITTTSFNSRRAYTKVVVWGKAVRMEIEPTAIPSGEGDFFLEGQTRTPKVVRYDADGNTTITPFKAEVDVENSPNPECVSVNASTGAIKAMGKGQAVVRYFIEGCEPVSVPVTVTPAPERIAMSRGSFTMGLSERYNDLHVVLTPHDGQTEDECRAIVTWTSNKANIVRVIKTGDYTCRLEAKKQGKAVITATTHNGKRAAITVTVAKNPTSVTVSPNPLNLSPGMVGKLNPGVNKGAGSGKFTFESLNADIVAVDENGYVTASAEAQAGQAAQVRVRAFNGRPAVANVRIHALPDTLSLNKTSITMLEAKSDRLVATAHAGDVVTYANYRFESSDDSIVHVDPGTGAIKALHEGTATITVSAVNAPECATASCEVTVIAAPANIDIYNYTSVQKLSGTTIALGLSETAYGITLVLEQREGASTCDADVSWSTSNKKVVSLTRTSNKLKVNIKGVKKGSATITATTHNGLRKSFRVTVKAKPSKLTLSPSYVGLVEGQRRKLGWNAGKNAASYGITFSGFDSSIISVDSNGWVTALQPGITKVKGRTYNKKNSNTITVRVFEVARGLRINESSKALASGMTWTVPTKVIGVSGAEEYNPSEYPGGVKYEVIEGSEYAKVSSGGVVTALAKGRAVVRASLNSNPSVYEDCIIEVLSPAASIEFTMKPAAEIEVGKTYPITVRVIAADGSELPEGTYSCTYTSSNAAVAITRDSSNLADAILEGKRIGKNITVTVRTYNGVTNSFKLDYVLLPQHQSRYRLFRAYSFYKSGKKGDLPFPKNNSDAVGNAFSRSNINGYKYQNLANLKNPSKSTLLNNLKSRFADSVYTDVNVIYLCSHGTNYYGEYRWQLPGYSAGKPSTFVTAKEIINAVKTIEGWTVIIVDSCYSGIFINNVENALPANDKQRVAILTAAGNTTACYYNVSEKKGACDLFTHSLVEGIGYNEKDKRFTDTHGSVTVEEFFTYGKNKTLNYIGKFGYLSTIHGNRAQTPQAFYNDNELKNLVIWEY